MRNEVVALPMAAYQAEHGISQSGLKELAKSPAHLREYIDHPKPDTPDQIIGTITHTGVFEPHLFEGCCYPRPAEYTNKKGEKKKWNGNATECKEWKSSHSDRPVVSAENYQDILGIRDAILSHPAARLALEQGRPEMCLFCEDPETGLQLKCRTDWLSGTSIVDLKTCLDASKLGFSRTVAKFGYDIQSAFNLDIANRLGLEKENFIFIAAEKKPPYAVAVYLLDEESIEIGRSKYRRLLTRYMECVSTDTWPGYSRNIERLSLPTWARKAEFDAAEMYENPDAPALEV